MNFFSQRRAIVGSAYYFLFIFAAIFQMYFLTSLETITRDIFWHIQLGEEIIGRGNFPFKDDYSFTWQGQEHSWFPYLFDSLMFSLTNVFGYEFGIHLYMFGVFVLLITLFHFFYIRGKCSLVLACMGVAILTLFYEFRMMVRPELIYYLFVLIGLYFYKNALREFNLASYLAIFILVLLWSNYHQPIIGYVLFFGLYIDLAIRALTDRAPLAKWLMLFFSGLLLVAASWINPFFISMLLEIIVFDERWKDVIQEFDNIFTIFHSTYLIIFVYLFLFSVILIALKEKRYGYLFVLVFLTAYSIDVSRLIAITGVIAAVMVIDMLAEYSRQEKGSSLKEKTYRTYPAVVFLFCVPMIIRIAYASGVVEGQSPKHPKYLTEYFINQKYSGNILNDHAVGGYLIYQLYPQAKVAIDGRTGLLYDYNFFLEYKSIMQSLENPDMLKKKWKDYSVDYLVLDNEILFISKDTIDSGVFKLDFVDEGYSLYTKGSGNFEYSGPLYWKPYCWNPDVTEMIKAEAELAAGMNGIKPGFIEFQQSIISFKDLTKEEKEPYLPLTFDNSLNRFYFYQAFFDENYEKASFYFSYIADRENIDLLALAKAKLEMNERDNALKLINASMEDFSLEVTDKDRMVLLLLLEEISETGELPANLSELQQGLDTYFNENKMNTEKREINQELICQGVQL